jgi:hypothetical protein
MTRKEYLLRRAAEDPRLTLSRKEAGQLLGFGRTTVDRLVKTKALISYKDTSGRRRIHANSAYDFEARRDGGLIYE